MLEALKAPVLIDQMQCVVQASIGIAVYPQDGATAEILMRNADAALYKAKSHARGSTVFFEDSMNTDSLRVLRIEQRLRGALERDELQQFYQRKFRANDGSPAGFEALARWTDEELGPVSPAEFIAVAEDSALIGSIDRWALRTACHNARRWLDMGLPFEHIAVNCSLSHLDISFVEFVEKCVRAYELPGNVLELEITESTLAERPDEVGALLHRIRALGMRVAIDDFGTGYSSMAVLQKMPIDVLKIDRAFVTQAPEDENAGQLLKAMIGVAHGLHKEVVAEGVETAEQAALLRSLGCEYLQGYLLARPVSAAQIEKEFPASEARQRA
jgi:EAL domain-containing protein (putative c-di-GMP-specific phosphodiesterase class I)